MKLKYLKNNDLSFIFGSLTLSHRNNHRILIGCRRCKGSPAKIQRRSESLIIGSLVDLPLVVTENCLNSQSTGERCRIVLRIRLGDFYPCQDILSRNFQRDFPYQRMIRDFRLFTRLSRCFSRFNNPLGFSTEFWIQSETDSRMKDGGKNREIQNNVERFMKSYQNFSLIICFVVFRQRILGSRVWFFIPLKRITFDFDLNGRIFEQQHG